jgi:hypothetical protein
MFGEAGAVCWEGGDIHEKGGVAWDHHDLVQPDLN